jgi:hypothetical protein
LDELVDALDAFERALLPDALVCCSRLMLCDAVVMFFFFAGGGPLRISMSESLPVLLASPPSSSSTSLSTSALTRFFDDEDDEAAPNSESLARCDSQGQCDYLLHVLIFVVRPPAAHDDGASGGRGVASENQDSDDTMSMAIPVLTLTDETHWSECACCAGQTPEALVWREEEDKGCVNAGPRDAPGRHENIVEVDRIRAQSHRPDWH